MRTQRGVGGDAVREIYAQQCVAGELTGDPVPSCALAHGSPYFGRGLLGSWPQTEWHWSISAGDWQSSEKLTRLCTIPEPATLSGTWDRTPYAMEARICDEKISGDQFGELHF
jgi:hypothetical protein